MQFKGYLKENVAPSTAKRYLREITLFFEKTQSPTTANYQQIMEYLGELRAKQKGKSIHCSLCAIKKYYNYLLVTNQREDHPCKTINLRDRKSRDIQLQDLFKPTELEQLLERKERYSLLKNRNRIILSLLIYQALTNGDVINLEIESIKLEQGTIYIKRGRKTNTRTLKLESKQVYWLMKYLAEDRPKLLQGNTTNQLMIASNGRPLTGEGICYVVETQKHMFPNRMLHAKTIRQSVITNLLKSGHDLRVVQAFAGHKYPSTTEKYKQTEVEILKNEVLKYHPLQ